MFFRRFNLWPGYYVCKRAEVAKPSANRSVSKGATRHWRTFSTLTRVQLQQHNALALANQY